MADNNTFNKVPIAVTKILTPYSLIIFLPDYKMYPYASMENFAGQKAYPLATSIFSSVIDDINSRINGRTIKIVHIIMTRLDKI